jgi:glycosyltransferase involved in cell wall biosynthesis
MVDGVRIVRRGSKYSVYKEARAFYNDNKNDFDLVVDEINTKPFDTPSFVHDKPIVALIHQLAREFWFYETPLPLAVLGYCFLEKFWLRKYHDVPTITVSNSTKQDLQHWGFSNIHVVPEGLSFSALQNLPEVELKPTVLFVGRLKKAKQPDHALKAFRIIKDHVPDARLWIVGSGYMEERLRVMANEMFPEGSSYVTIFGKQSQERKLELMSRAHVLLVPGVREGWGLVVSEANAMGTPAVAYNAPGLRDSVINNVTGQLVERNNYAEMAKSAVAMLSDHILRKTYAKNAMQNAKHLDWKITADNFLSIFLEVSKGERTIAGEPSIA